jgi:hypothetical protein
MSFTFFLLWDLVKFPTGGNQLSEVPPVGNLKLQNQ